MTAPITMWRIRWGQVTRVECSKVTEKSVWPLANSRRRARISDWDSYYETWQDAHKILLAQAEKKLRDARLQLERAQGDHARIKGMKPPADAEVSQ